MIRAGHGARRAAARWYATMPLALVLSACGGGEVASTPNPTPTPTPTPTGPVNADLLGPLKTESFANLAVRATGNFDTSLRPKVSASSVSATFRYDAAAQTYSLTSPSGSITFGKNEIDASQSSAAATVYAKRNGNTTDFLTVTKAGTSGTLTYRYVGSAFWEHSVVGTNSGSGTVDALVYGAPTADAAVPRTGSAIYALDVLGVTTTGAGTQPLVGSGTAAVEFASGQIVLTGTTVMMPGTPFTDNFHGSGALASAGNGFSGKVTFEDFQVETGDFKGQFFGPDASEIGLSFAAKSSNPSNTYDSVAVGTMTGRKSSTAALTFPDGHPATPVILTTTAKEATFTSTAPLTDNDASQSFGSVTQGDVAMTIAWDGSHYTLTTPAGTRTYVDNFYTGLRPLQVATGSYSATLTSYTATSSGGMQTHRLDNAVFGASTPVASVPLSGTGHYDLSLQGYAVENGRKNILLAWGNGALDVNFTTGALGLTGKMTLAEYYNLATRPAMPQRVGALTGSGTLAASTNSFSTSMAFESYTGALAGNFFGPKANEVAGTWQASGGSTGGTAMGTFRGSDASRFAGFTDQLQPKAFDYIPVSQRELDYGYAMLQWTPSSGTYEFRPFSQPFGISVFVLDKSDIVAGKGTALADYYAASDGNINYTGLIAKHDNSGMTYTYLGFADISATVAADATQPPRRLLSYFGYPTAARPTSGSATYKGEAMGQGHVAALGYTGAVSGTSSFSADFANGALTADLALSTTEATARTVGTFSQSGTMGANGAFTLSNSSGVQTMMGQLFGPGAEEVGARWSYQQGDALSIDGIAVARKN
ncbi:transferrin-binding protein-like solute binding protein [Novosphingobium pokkalii]|uniref:Transferrin-binding protein-like solute binding protein n=1 Tax=Novosphingobium pokkalii TaxID=1770194 RepID=A0ABV7V8C9_9SPHN|nr:transferrin-binding protein-like solute binding protein [Novosphingobium pokkalii]